jgi:hypothetical protein
MAKTVPPPSAAVLSKARLVVAKADGEKKLANKSAKATKENGS